VTGHGVLPGLWPIQGDGVLARQRDLVLLMDPAGGAFTDRLLDLLADAARAGHSGSRFTDLVSAEFEAHASAGDVASGEPAPAVVAFGSAGAGTAIAVYGTGWADVTTTYGVQRLTAGEPYGQLRCVLPSALIKIRAGVRARAGDDETDPYLRLADGVVRAVGLVFAPAEIGPEAAGQGEEWAAEPAAAEEPVEAEAGAEARAVRRLGTMLDLSPRRPGPEPPGDQPAEQPAVSPHEDFISAPLLGDQAGDEVPRRDPLPLGAEPPAAEDLGLVDMPAEMVEGVRCKNDHFNDPDARYCAVCGIGMGQVTKNREQGKRPPLGVLILGDGSVCQVDADYVIGREPSLDPAVADGRARPMRLTGASGVVSRTHARVELDGWEVFITDLNSANGTEVLRPGERNATRLQPGIRTPLVPGMQIRLGEEYIFQYDSHRHR
jgi:hypothetical protein